MLFRSRARVLIPVVLAAAGLLGLAPSTPAAARGELARYVPAAPVGPTEAQQIITIAKAQLGDPFRWGATGPYAFDCSGLVIYSFKAAGDGAVIRADTLRTAQQIYLNFKARGLASRYGPKPGDLVVWGGGAHIGIYIGDGRAISTLRSGVRVHLVSAVTLSFTAYLHTGMSTRYTNG